MIHFLKNFFAQSGAWVASSFFVSKISAFLLTLFMARILSKEDFGWVMYGLNYLGFFIPFIGFGSSHGALRYAAMVPSAEEKKQILQYSFSYGFVINFLLNFMMLLLAFVIFGNGNKLLLIGVFSIRLLGIFLLDQAKSEIRGQHNNRKFGQLDIASNLLLLVLSVALSFFYGVNGYIFSLCVSPFVVFFFHRFSFSFKRNWRIPFNEKAFWKFCFSMAITNQLSELIFLLDIFFIGLWMDNVAVAHYRIYLLIPFNLFFLSALFFQTAYPQLCEKHKDNTFQLHFLFNFWKLMTPISIMIIAITFFFDEFILNLFGSDYSQNTIPFKILILAAVTVLLLRTPFGYLLASKGKSQYNLISASISILSLMVFIKPVIINYGLEGVAWLSFGNLFFIGIFLLISFFYEVKRTSKD